MNILVLCTYPIKHPRHGGQLRVRNIVDAYQRAGHKVEVRGVLGSIEYEDEEGFLPLPGKREMATILANTSLMEDYAIGRLFANSNHYFNKLARTINTTPDAIHIEQPWLFPFAQRFSATQHQKPRLLYGSQNVEWHLKQAIVNSNAGAETAHKYAELVRELELEAIANADAIACVSEKDAEWIRSLTDKPVVLAPNGVKPWHTTEGGRKEAESIIQRRRFALYCASAHPPNITGFFDMFSGGFGSLKPDERLVVAGGAGWSIADDDRVNQSAKLREKLVLAGIVSQPCLEGLLDASHAIVLPITQGGGTNLKTAEALWAGKHIIATSVAMRGFEHFIGSSGVYLADDPRHFKQFLRASMESEPLNLSAEEREKRREVLWEKCLNPLIAQLKELTEDNNA